MLVYKLILLLIMYLEGRKIVRYKDKYELYKMDVLNTLQLAKNEEIYRQ